MCRCYCVPASKLERFLAKVIETQFLGTEIRARVREALADRTEIDRKSVRSAIGSRLDELNRKIDKGTENLLLEQTQSLSPRPRDRCSMAGVVSVNPCKPEFESNQIGIGKHGCDER